MTGASQDRMRGSYKTQAHSMMFNVNKYSILLLGISKFRYVYILCRAYQLYYLLNNGFQTKLFKNVNC